jgi:hypothetical protein
VHHAHFPSIVLEPEAQFRSRTRLTFTAQ